MSLTDPRVVKHARILVNYSTKVRKGDKALIVADWLARPLVLEVYKELLKAGAVEVLVHFDVDEQIASRAYNEFSEAYLKLAKPYQRKYFPRIADEIVKNVDCWYRLYATSNTRGFSNIDSNVVSARSKVIRPIIDYRVLKTRWVLTNFPTEPQAQEAEMSLSEYEDFMFKAINDVDWEKKRKEQEKLREVINRTSEVHIVGPQTDLRLNIKGRKAVNAAGENNMPDGEVFTSVVENKANGFITYTYPAVYMGKEFHNVRLEFKDGKVVKAAAEKREDDLNKIIDVDSGGRFIGELGIGNNFQISRFTKDILFDEKIGGSVHLALGKGYEECLSKNKSALHWDMIKDLRVGGSLYFDNKLVQKDGKWMIRL